MTGKIYFLICVLLVGSLLNSAKVHGDTGVSAQSAVVIEQSTGRVLYSKNADAHLPMASTTKIMTAICAIENGNLEDEVPISAHAATTEGSSMYLQEGEKMNLEELLYGLMLSSGNDAAVAIAEHFGGNEAFVEMMNQKTKEVGALDTNFANPNGLPDESHYSTAHDMARITAYGLKNSEFAKIVSSKTYKVQGEGKAYPRQLTNHNKLLGMCKGCIGVKTGFTKAAGRCLVSACERDGMTLICVTLNAPDDWRDHCNLYDTLFSEYKMKKIINSGQRIKEISVENSETDKIIAVADRDVYYPLSSGEKIDVKINSTDNLIAPVNKDEMCGEMLLFLNDREIGRMGLLTDRKAEKISAVKVMKDEFKKNLQEIYRKWLTFMGS